MGRPVFIIHFQPLELYPPVMNLLRCMERNNNTNRIEVVTTRHGLPNISTFRSGSKLINIMRFGKANNRQRFARRLLNYIFFYLAAIFRLILSRPSRIMYYETLSSYPVYLYKKYINKNAEVFIHYHEYSSKQEYVQGMKLVRFFHRKERYLYQKAQWISHTNEGRMKMFLDDENLKLDGRFHMLKNYPPISWSHIPSVSIQMPVKLIYVGALSLETMFISQFAEWVVNQNGRVSWDIYSTIINSEVKEFLGDLKTHNIHLHVGVDYYELPAILKHYDVGVILYKGHIPNYVYNAPNKLFEYRSCGLDVWFPDLMQGCHPYITSNSYPKVIAVDFFNLQHYNLEDAVNKDGLKYIAPALSAEHEYEHFCEHLVMNNK